MVSGLSAVSAAGRFTRTFIVTNIVIYQRPLRISNLTHPTLHGGLSGVEIMEIRTKMSILALLVSEIW